MRTVHNLVHMSTIVTSLSSTGRTVCMCHLHDNIKEKECIDSGLGVPLCMLLIKINMHSVALAHLL